MSNIIAILQLIPALIAAIKAIEAAIPGSGQGEAKLAAIRESLEVADAKASEIWPKIEAVVGIFVALFNKTKAF